MSDWLENLKIGDPVIVESFIMRYLAKVESVTKTHVVAADRRFNRKTGMEIKGKKWLTQPTEKTLQQLAAGPEQ